MKSKIFLSLKKILGVLASCAFLYCGSSEEHKVFQEIKAYSNSSLNSANKIFVTEEPITVEAVLDEDYKNCSCELKGEFLDQEIKKSMEVFGNIAQIEIAKNYFHDAGVLIFRVIANCEGRSYSSEEKSIAVYLGYQTMRNVTFNWLNSLCSSTSKNTQGVHCLDAEDKEIMYYNKDVERALDMPYYGGFITLDVQFKKVEYKILPNSDDYFIKLVGEDFYYHNAHLAEEALANEGKTFLFVYPTEIENNGLPLNKSRLEAKISDFYYSLASNQ